MLHFNLSSKFVAASFAVTSAAAALTVLAVPVAQAQPQPPQSVWNGGPGPGPGPGPGVMPPPPGGPAYGGPDRGRGPVIRCESNDGRYRECRVPFRGPAVLVQQLSSTRCIPGRTYGTTRSGRIWVNGGCRGDFAPR